MASIDVPFGSSLKGPKARLLYRVMSGISEDHTCAGWHPDCEFALWATLTGQDVAGVKGWMLADEDVAELRLAHEVAGGRLRMPDEQGGPKLLPTSEWFVHLAAISRS